MSGVVKIEITESAETLKKLLINASTPQEKERIQTIYWQGYFILKRDAICFRLNWHLRCA